MTSDNASVALQSQVAEHEVRLDVHHENLEKHEAWIIKVMNRPPIWASFLITGLFGIVCAGAGAVIASVL